MVNKLTVHRMSSVCFAKWQHRRTRASVQHCSKHQVGLPCKLSWTCKNVLGYVFCFFMKRKRLADVWVRAIVNRLEVPADYR